MFLVFNVGDDFIGNCLLKDGVKEVNVFLSLRFCDILNEFTVQISIQLHFAKMTTKTLMPEVNAAVEKLLELGKIFMFIIYV